MAQYPYLGEIRIFAGTFAPIGWMVCGGQLLPVDEYEDLFQLIGTSYGGDGQSTFALPDLHGRIPVDQGNGFTVAGSGGAEEVTLTARQIPEHSHAWLGSEAPATALTPLNNTPAEASKRFYVAPTTVSAMASEAIAATGGSQPHNNLQPYLCLNFIIALFGTFPSPN